MSEKRYSSLADCYVERIVAGLVGYCRARQIPALASWEFTLSFFGRAAPDLLVLLPGQVLPTCLFVGQPLENVVRNDALYKVQKINPTAAELNQVFAMSRPDAEAVLCNTSIVVCPSGPTAHERAFLGAFTKHLAVVASFRYVRP